jgi:hypothetical protein
LRSNKAFGAANPPFAISEAQRDASDRSFPPVAVGRQRLTAFVAVRTGVRVDATRDPGIVLLASVVPKVPVDGGVRRIAGVQLVATEVAVDFNQSLPISWMASVMRQGDLSPNQATAPYSGLSDAFQLNFPGELVISHEGGDWKLPNYDSSQYIVNVGFGVGAVWATWGYSVPCQPGQTITGMEADGYLAVKSGGDVTIGHPVPDLDSWPMPLGWQYLLTFDQSGKGLLTRI